MTANLATLLLILLVAVVLVLGHIAERNMQDKLDNWKPRNNVPPFRNPPAPNRKGE